MNLRKLGLVVVFLSGAIIGGLALAFLLVVFRPELLLHAAPTHNAVTDAPQTAPALSAATTAAQFAQIHSNSSSIARSALRPGPSARAAGRHNGLCIMRHFPRQS